MKRLLTTLYKCLKCGHIVSLYNGTNSFNLHCRECGAINKWKQLK